VGVVAANATASSDPSPIGQRFLAGRRWYSRREPEFGQCRSFPLDNRVGHAIVLPLCEVREGVAMPARWVSALCAFAAISAVAGCAMSGPNLKTPMPERFALPPADDARFSEPIAYPKDTLNQDSVIKPGNNQKLPSQNPPPLTSPNAGGRGGMGGGPGGPNF
jgi:hypothetical protein